MCERYGDEFEAAMGAEAVQTLLKEIDLDQLSAALQLPMPLIYASVPVGAILFIFYALIFIGEDLRDMKQGPKAESAKEA